MKHKALLKWLLGLGLGTALPIWLSLQWVSGKTYQTEYPADCWEIIAVAFTGLSFIGFHGFELFGPARRLRKILVLLIVMAMGGVTTAWVFMNTPWAGNIFTQELRLISRLWCGLIMLGILSLVNCVIWLWSPRESDRRINYRISVLMLDLPTVLSLLGVFWFCYAIITSCPDGRFSNTNAIDLKLARIFIASTFYSGAAALHLMFGNAVFWFVHSGYLHKVLYNHSYFRPVRNP